MSGSHHEEHQLNEQKPIAFTVPLIMASVLILIMVLFLSLCDPKPHQAHEAHGAAAEAGHQTESTQNMHLKMSGGNREIIGANKTFSVDSIGAAPTEPVAEPTH